MLLNVAVHLGVQDVACPPTNHPEISPPEITIFEFLIASLPSPTLKVTFE